MSEAKQTIILLAVPLSFCFTWKALPANSKPPAPSCAKSHQNSTPVQVGATCMCWPKNKAKENGHCQKTCEGFWQLFGKGRLFGRPFFKTNPQELSTLVYLPLELLNNTKNVSIKKTLSISTLAQYFILLLQRHIWDFYGGCTVPAVKIAHFW